MGKRSRIILRPENSALESEILTRVEAVLAGEIGIDAASEWAVEAYVELCGGSAQRSLAGSALRILMTYKFVQASPDRDMIEIRAVLKGEREYAVIREEYTPEDIERSWPGALATDEEMVKQWPPYAKYLERDP